MRNRNNFIGLWLDDNEYSHLHEQCKASGMTASSFVRKLILSVEIHPRPPDTYAALLRELSAIGNNINQIAHWANARKSVSEPEIVDAAVMAKEAYHMVKEAL